LVDRTPDADRYLSVAEVAELVGFSTQTIRDWIIAKRLPALQIQRSYRIRQSDVERVMESFRTSAPGESGESFWEDPEAQGFQAPGRGGE
jgi:excisionase family DNA binding protein